MPETHQLLLAIERTGSLTQAARVLRVNYSTVRRRLTEVEDRLKVALFERGPAGYRPTSAGRDYLSTIAQADQLIADAERHVAGRELQADGTLRITTTQAFFSHYLTPLLPGFLVLHPGIRLSFSFGNAFRDLSRREADVALRFSTDPGDTLVGVRLFDVSFAHYRHISLREATDPCWIGWAEDNKTSHWLPSGPMPQAPIGVWASDELAQLSLLQAGQGMAWMPCYLCDPDKRLERVPGSAPKPQIELWALTHPDLRTNPRVRAFLDYFLPILRSDAARFRGETT
ncbi:LysR family transcriptional regulator [Actibacterium mucosum]|nr:LysR family transcriptional regulator [Actibacterium mucosum]